MCNRDVWLSHVSNSKHDKGEVWGHLKCLLNCLPVPLPLGLPLSLFPVVVAPVLLLLLLILLALLGALALILLALPFALLCIRRGYLCALDLRVGYKG